MSLKYTPYQFQPDTTYLSREEHSKMMDDLRNRPIDFIDYLLFVKSMTNDDPLYKSMLNNLGRGNLKNLKFKSDERKILKLINNPLLNLTNYSKVMDFYKKYKDQYPVWAKKNGFFFNDLKNKYNPQSN
jgi:hypothetical protein